MKRIIFCITTSGFKMFFLQGCNAQSSQNGKELSLTMTIPLPGVSGRIDHLAFDTRTQRVFVAALGNNTVEIVD